MNFMADKAFIVEAVRTAGGKRDGRLSLWHPADLGAKVLDEIVSRLDMDPELVDDVIFGCVDQVGAQSGNIAGMLFFLLLFLNLFLVLLWIDNAVLRNKQFILLFKQ